MNYYYEKEIVIATKSIVKIKMYYVFKWKTAFKLMRARGRQIQESCIC